MTSTEHADLTLRPAAAQEAETLTGVYFAARSAAPMPAPVHGREQTRTWFEQLLGRGQPPGREAWVATGTPGAVLGYLLLDPAWLHSLYVRPEHAGRGVGSALLGLAKALRPDGFGLWVFETNIGAQRFYARHGLTVAERTDGAGNEERAPDLRMAWAGERSLSVGPARVGPMGRVG